jgi:hypothetical protein
MTHGADASRRYNAMVQIATVGSILLPILFLQMDAAIDKTIGAEAEVAGSVGSGSA